jgi:hypothetical protein
MNYPQKLAGIALLLTTPCAAGCLARVAPFDQMDRAQVTVLRLSQPQPAVPTPQAGALPGLPGLPALPPQLAAMGQQVLQGVQNAVPGLIPNVPGLPGAAPATPQAPLFKGYSIVGQMPLQDAGLRDELLDIFGRESSFNNQAQRCFSPGMAFVLQRPNGPEVDLLISLSCNQAMMDGARWPHPVNGFTPETRDRLGKIYEKLFGPVPPGA